MMASPHLTIAPRVRQEMFVENVFDELDAPGEFYYDPSRPGTGAPTLWLWHNASGGTPPPSTGIVAPSLTVLINASSSQQARPIYSNRLPYVVIDSHI